MNAIRRKLRQWKEAFNRSLEKMAEENKRQFGQGRLDCCGLNGGKATGGDCNTCPSGPRQEGGQGK